MADRRISKDTQLCISLASRPSDVGTRFHNLLYDLLDLDFVYKACSTTDLGAAIGGVRALGIRGCGVSMPFKEAALAYVDDVEAGAAHIGALNTIVNDGDRLRGLNTDHRAVRELVRELNLLEETPYVVAGSGGMAKAVLAALADVGLRNGTLVARHGERGPVLAERYGATWCRTFDEGRVPIEALVINATPVGMSGTAEEHRLAVPAYVVDAARAVIDVVAVPVETPLVSHARERSIPVVTGATISARQAAAQFEQYTGVRPTHAQVQRAIAHATG